MPVSLALVCFVKLSPYKLIFNVCILLDFDFDQPSLALCIARYTTCCYIHHQLFLFFSRQSLRLSNASNQETTTGEIVNLVRIAILYNHPFLCFTLLD